MWKKNKSKEIDSIDSRTNYKLQNMKLALHQRLLEYYPKIGMNNTGSLTRFNPTNSTNFKKIKSIIWGNAVYKKLYNNEFIIFKKLEDVNEVVKRKIEQKIVIGDLNDIKYLYNNTSEEYKGTNKQIYWIIYPSKNNIHLEDRLINRERLIGIKRMRTNIYEKKHKPVSNTLGTDIVQMTPTHGVV